MSIFDRLESDVRSYCRQFPAVFVTASGGQLTDEQGRTYIDFLSGAGALNYGHNDPEMKRAVIDFLNSDGLVQGLDLHTQTKATFLEAFETIILQPRALDYKVQFVGPTGATGVESALKLARKVKRRSNIIAFSNSFHGLTQGALAVTGNRYYRNEAYVNRNNVSFMSYDGYLGSDFDTIKYLRRVLEDQGSGVDLPAAVIVETVQADGGVNVASSAWLKELALICQEFDILLIVDDVQAGCGRTGPFFSFEEAELSPDIVVLSKSLSGFGLPMAMLLLKPEIDQWQPGEQTGTFRGNNLAFLTAVVALRRFWQDDALTFAVRRKGELIRSRLLEISASLPAANISVRGKGMLNGWLMPRREDAQNVIRSCFDRGLLIESCGPKENVLKLSPPLTMDEDLLLQGIEILQCAVVETVKKAVSEV